MVQVDGFIKGPVPSVSSYQKVPKNNTWLGNFIEHAACKLELIAGYVQMGYFFKQKGAVFEVGSVFQEELMDFLALRKRFGSNAGFEKVFVIKVETSEGVCRKVVG